MKVGNYTDKGMK